MAVKTMAYCSVCLNRQLCLSPIHKEVSKGAWLLVGVVVVVTQKQLGAPTQSDEADLEMKRQTERTTPTRLPARSQRSL